MARKHRCTAWLSLHIFVRIRWDLHDHKFIIRSWRYFFFHVWCPIEYFYNFCSWIAAMQSREQSELRRYLHLTKACRDIATKIRPQWFHWISTLREDVSRWCLPNDCSWWRLDPELSNAPLAVKIEFCELNLETLRELQSRSSSAASTANTIMQWHQPAGRPPRSRASSAVDAPVPPVPPPMPSIQQSPAGFLHGCTRHTTGKLITDL